MSRSTKPRKRYREKPIHVPMTGAGHTNAAVKMRMAVHRLINEPSADTFNEATRQMATIADALSHMRGGQALANYRDPAANGVRTAILTLDAVAKRCERTSVLSVTEAEATSLHAACNQLDGELSRIPSNILEAAAIMVGRMK